MLYRISNRNMQIHFVTFRSCSETMALLVFRIELLFNIYRDLLLRIHLSYGNPPCVLTFPSDACMAVEWRTLANTLKYHHLTISYNRDTKEGSIHAQYTHIPTTWKVTTMEDPGVFSHSSRSLHQTNIPNSQQPPVQEVADVIRSLTQTPPSTQKAAIEKFFTKDASFTHPFCRTGSFYYSGTINSRNLIQGIYRWYKIMSPQIELEVDSIGTFHFWHEQFWGQWGILEARKPVWFGSKEANTNDLLDNSIRQILPPPLRPHLPKLPNLDHPLLPRPRKPGHRPSTNTR